MPESRISIDGRRVKIIDGIGSDSSLLDEVDHLGDGVRRDANFIAAGPCGVNARGSRSTETRIGEPILGCGMGIGHGKDHQKSARGKSANISARF
jgi:hypothetical protein